MYRLNSNLNLLYYINKSKSNFLCISTSLYLKIFQFAHDNHAHNNIVKSLNKIKRNAYIFKLKKTLQLYINNYFACQLFKFFRRLSYESLYSIETYKKKFFELFINFIVELSKTSKKYNCFDIVIDKFFKYVCLLLEKKTWKAKKWANLYYCEVYRYWNISAKIIIDRDLQFINNFWIRVF